MTAGANLFPQALHALSPASPDLELPLPYDTTLTMNSGLGLFAMADYNLVNGNIDYHSSNQIFDQFNATFGSLDGI